MRLARKIKINSAALIVGLALVGLAALWGLERLRADVRVAREEYRELRQLAAVQVQVAKARGLLGALEVDRAGVEENLQQAVDHLNRFIALEEDAAGPSAHRRVEFVEARAALAKLEHALGMLRTAEAAGDRLWIPEAQMGVLDEAAGHLAAMAGEMDDEIAQTHESANLNLRTTRAVVAGLLGVLVATAVVGSVYHLRSVMRPVRQLREGVARLAAGKFDQRVEAAGDDELSELAGDFNRMAADLDRFYRRLEDMVEAKSRELVRSERLASVGFLAAGVAHEINNPLSIIAGYAQASMQDLATAGTPGRPGDPPDVAEMRRNWQIVADESFRCKEIVQKLLSLAKPSGDAPGPVSVAQTARDVAVLVRGLPHFRDRRLKLEIDEEADLTVTGSGPELKQVVLNLTINALESVEPGVGEVSIEASRRNGTVSLAVRDNGRGLSREAIQHVFEPFYTTKRGANEPGTGLGLSISHAIVAAHGGRLRAESDGVGKGAHFVIELAAAGQKGLGHDHG